MGNKTLSDIGQSETCAGILSEISGILGECHNSMERAEEAVFGPSPQTCSEAAPPPSGGIVETLNRIRSGAAILRDRINQVDRALHIG